MCLPSGRRNRLLKLVYPMASFIRGDFSWDDFLPGGTNVYSWVKELPCNKAILPDAGLPHPSPALEYILVMLIFAEIIQHQLRWQSPQSYSEQLRADLGPRANRLILFPPFPSFLLLQVIQCWSPPLPSPAGGGGAQRHTLGCNSRVSEHYPCSLRSFWLALSPVFRA